jgi:hypothetical protein
MDGDGNSDERGGDASSEQHELSARQRDIAVAGWCSFLIAAVATMVFFAFIDPMTLAEAAGPPLPLDRMSGYALGFFFLWALTGASAALTLYLTRTSHAEPPQRN